MLEPDFNPEPTAIQIWRCGYLAPCRAPRCPTSRATIVLRQIDASGRPVRQIELCDRHAEIVIAREQKRLVGEKLFMIVPAEGERDATDHQHLQVRSERYTTSFDRLN
jgi:hypothetical protein